MSETHLGAKLKPSFKKTHTSFNLCVCMQGGGGGGRAGWPLTASSRSFFSFFMFVEVCCQLGSC